MAEYIPNAGQTYVPVDKNIYIPMVDYTPAAEPVPPIPAPELNDEFVARGYVLGDWSQHFLPGVTAEMLDWFWVNMEKCYYLWAPGSHKRFNWVREPWQYGFEKSAHMISESVAYGQKPFGGDGVQINRLAVSEWFPFKTSLDHVICEGIFNDLGEFVDSTIHMWQDVDGGCIHLTASVANPNISEPPGFVKKMLAELAPGEAVPTPSGSDHSSYEASMWPRFLPTMFGLWQGHPDPSQNVQCDLTVQWKDGKISYVHPNGPVELAQG